MPQDKDEEESKEEIVSEKGLPSNEIFKETVRVEIVRIVECQSTCGGPGCHEDSCVGPNEKSSAAFDSYNEDVNYSGDDKYSFCSEQLFGSDVDFCFN